MFQNGLRRKDEAYKHLYFLNGKRDYKDSITLLEDDIKFTESLILQNSPELNIPELKEEIKSYEDNIEEIKAEKSNSLNVKGIFFAGRRPLSFLLEQEVAISSVLSLTILITFIFSFFWASSIITQTHIAFQFILGISIIYSFSFFAIVNILNKKISLSYEEEFKKNAPDHISIILSKYDNQFVEFEKLEAYKDFFKHYFLFFRTKATISLCLSSSYFLIASLLFYIYELLINDNDTSEYLMNFWLKFFITVVTFLLLSHIWFSSFTMTSLIKTAITNFVLLLLLYGAYTYTMNGDWILFIEKLENSVKSASIISFALSYLISATRKMFLDDENSIVWKLK